MKKTILLGLAVIFSLGAMADGTKIDATELTKITFSGNQIVLHYKNGTQQTVDDMETVTVDMSSATSIEERIAISEKAGLEGKAVYNMAGQLVGNSTARLAKGIYIINGKKVIIK
jgi:ABC-type molybdate transport system substrate-binding protein